MEALATRAQVYARAQPVALAGPRWGVTDWDLVAATTVTVRDALRAACPGSGEDAALKGHTVLAVGCGAPVPSHGSAARAHDRRPRQREASWRGSGLWADLASARWDRLRACDTHGVRYVLRRQETWKPQVDPSARGQVTHACFPGTDCEALWEDAPLLLDGRAGEAGVQVGTGKARVQVRLVSVQTAQGYGCFRTPLPPRLGPRQGADRYRVRGEVARSLRRDTSVHRLDALDAEPPCTLQTRVPASLIASTIAALLAHTHTLQRRPQAAGTPRTQAPLHPRRWAWPWGVSCHSMAQAFELTGAEATRRGNTIAEVLTHSGKDPTWRRRPSVLAQLRGGKRQPLARKQASDREVHPRHIKAAA